MCIWKKLAFDSGACIKGSSLAVWAGNWGPEGNKMVEVGGFSLLELGRPTSPALECWSSWFSGLQTSGLLWDLHQRSLSSLWTQAELHTLRLSWFPSLCIADGESSQPPQLHKPVPITKLFTCLFYWLCFSGEL